MQVDQAPVQMQAWKKGVPSGQPLGPGIQDIGLSERYPQNSSAQTNHHNHHFA